MLSLSFTKNINDLFKAKGDYGYAIIHKILESGKSKAELGDYKTSIKEYTKAMKIKPKEYEAYYYRGLASAFEQTFFIKFVKCLLK